MNAGSQEGIEFRLVIGKKKTAAGKDIPDPLGKPRPYGSHGRVEVDLAFFEDDRHLSKRLGDAAVSD